MSSMVGKSLNYAQLMLEKRRDYATSSRMTTRRSCALSGTSTERKWIDCRWEKAPIHHCPSQQPVVLQTHLICLDCWLPLLVSHAQLVKTDVYPCSLTVTVGVFWQAIVQLRIALPLIQCTGNARLYPNKRDGVFCSIKQVTWTRFGWDEWG